MDWTNQCAAVIPCFNEAAAVTRVVKSVGRHFSKVIVVDDGSTDGTGAAAAQAGALVLRHETNKGKGAALSLGLRHALDLNCRWALMLDGDGQHSANDIPLFLEAAAASRADLLVGNRMRDPAEMPVIRRWVNRWMSRRISRLTGADLPDTQCGFRLMRLDAWSSLNLKSSRFEIESELLVAFLAAGFKVDFVPIRVIYRTEHSKIHPLRDTWRWFRWWHATRKSLDRMRAGQAPHLPSRTATRAVAG